MSDEYSILPTKKCHVKIIFSSFIVQNCFVTGEKPKGLVHDREEKNPEENSKKENFTVFLSYRTLKNRQKVPTPIL